MAYFNELPLVEYPSRFGNKSSDKDYTTVRNLFRRAVLRTDIIDTITSFSYYQIKTNERPDQIAERFYGDPELDWVVLITNNIVDHKSQWPLSDESFYNYLLDKYETEEKIKEVKYYESNLTVDEYDRTIIPANLEIQTDLYQEFRTLENKENPLFYDLEFYPVPNEYYPLKVETNLSQYVEIWERGNLEENESYTGEEYSVSETFVKTQITPSIPYSTSPSYTRFDYSYLKVYQRDETSFNILVPNDLNGWPYEWGGNFNVYQRTGDILKVDFKPNINNSVNITDDKRLYTITSIDEVDFFTYTEGTTLENESNETYIVVNPKSSHKGIQSSFQIERNSKGEIIRVKVIDGGRDYIEGEIITIDGDNIGGVSGVDDIIITVSKTKPKAQFRFFSIGDTTNVPFPNMKISTFNETGISYLNSSYTKVDVFDNQNEITNYEYENQLNEKYRNILILRPEYVNVFIGELRNIMTYDKSTETIAKNTKRVQVGNLF